ncbi:GAF domain-containing sensor histidine kinase [Craurococcus roseus]|uniref:GAF domain-containing sensor histidine kinase n=1 Tax=Craurococcus roseus TaxID=77585 RepID=UPI0031D2EEB0
MNADQTTAADGAPGTDAAVRNEARLAALWRTGLLDTPPEEVFDRLTRLAGRLLGAPVILVSLVEADRQFFKSAVGLPEPWATRRQTPLSHSFCQHVVATGAPLRIADAREDPLVCDNLAVPDIGVVAYLGMPLATADGQVLGSLCAIDTKPRNWTAEDAAALRDLASLAMSEMSLRGLALELEAWLREEAAAREAVRARMARARRLEALGQLAGGVAHDFANVLQAVQGGVRLAAGRLDRDPAAARNLLDMVGGAANRGASVTRRLLAFARRGELGVARVNLVELLDGLEEMLAHTMNAPGLRVVVETEPGLPPVLADQGELETVLVNLATNARDAMPRGGTFTVGAAVETVADGAVPHPARLRLGRYVRLSAMDTGVGMDAGTLANAAEAFFTTKPEGEGRGLGLAMAREFAEQAGGGFAVASEPGRGTTVTFWLPDAEETGGNPARSAPEAGKR